MFQEQRPGGRDDMVDKTSLRAPLSSEAVERYAELFKQFYGMSVDELMG